MPPAKGTPVTCPIESSRSTMTPVPVQGVIFDCDGTLMDTMDLWLTMEDEFARQAGHELSDDERDMLRAFTLDETARYYHGELGLGSCEQDVKDMIEAYAVEYYAQRSELRPGAGAFVRALAEHGVRCTIASSSPHVMLDAGAAHTGLDRYLVAIVSTDDVGASKREPAVYERARELMGTDVEATWVFEDAAYALRTLAGTRFRTMGTWDKDSAGTFEELTALADHAVRTYEDLDLETFLAGRYATRALG